MKTIKLKETGSNFDKFYDAMTEELKTLWNQFEEESEEGFDYIRLDHWQNVFKPHGLTFDYELSAEPFNFKLTF